ncbi:MAG: hypothetical protein ACSW8J_04335, partial [bacterium]
DALDQRLPADARLFRRHATTVLSAWTALSIVFVNTNISPHFYIIHHKREMSNEEMENGQLKMENGG